MKQTEEIDTPMYAGVKHYIHEKTNINENDIDEVVAKKSKTKNDLKYWDNFIITFFDKKEQKKKTLKNGILKTEKQANAYFFLP